jgi:uncharacterized protein YutE (UPF0331/DUF86 family)
MDSISKHIDANNIVNSNISDIKLSKDFIEEYNISDLDWKLLESALHMEGGMTDYQCRHFVKNSQLTPWRSVRQCLLELETRYHSYVEIKCSLRKAEVLRKKFLRDYENCDDELAKELIEIDIDKNDYDITIWKRKYNQAQKEMDTFLNLIKEHVSTEEDIKFFTEVNESEERKYWIARMGKQAAMDIVSYGRIGSGNMDSIAMMDEQDQVASLEIAIKYSGMIGGGIDKINRALQPEFQNYLQEKGINAPQLLPHDFTGQKQL